MEFLMRITIYVSEGPASEVYTQLGDIMTAIAALPAGTRVSVVAEPVVQASTTLPFVPSKIGGVLYNMDGTKDTIDPATYTTHASWPTT
jgi:hypothetical protein